MTIQLDGSDPNFGESFLTLGWEVTQGQDPRYWLSSQAKAGFQRATDLVRIPAQLLASHTAIIAQSGSGKSFFLGRLIEEILLQTSARCLILDPNADFRRIHESETESLWTDAKYDQTKRRGKLPHEASHKEFSSRWSLITKRIRTADGTTGPAYDPLQIWWPSLSIAFLAQDLDPMLQSDLYHCHTFVKEFGDVFELKYSASQEPKEFLEETQGIFDLARALCKHEEKLRQTLTREFSAEQIVKELGSKGFPTPPPGFVYVDPRVYVPRSTIELTANSFIESALSIADDVSPEVERFYFGKARLYQRTGILQAGVHGRAWMGSPSRRLEVIDLPSLPPDTNTRLLAIDSILTSEWEMARESWRRALAGDALRDSRTPTFIVVDEAHNLIPKNARSKAHIALREQFRTIVAEGRKYGLFLILVSQRPDKLDSLILSECENKALMKLGSASVLKLTSKMLGLDDQPPKLLEKCLEFETGRVLLAGSWCPQPKIAYTAARRTMEGGRNLRENHWSVPLEITVLSLAPEARKAAIALQTKCPDIVFRRGRWSINEQARLMAGELLKNYQRDSDQLDAEPFNRTRLNMMLSGALSLGCNGPVNARIRKQLKSWLEAGSGAVTEDQLHDRLKESLSGMSELEREDVSAHLTGYAFDIRPPSNNSDEIEKYIKDLPGFQPGFHCLTRETEADEPLWHIQFHNHLG